MKMKYFSCVLLLIVSVYTYAQGEVAGNDWSKMGLKGKVKSVKTSIYFAEEKGNDFAKGSTLSQGIYPVKKIKQYSEMERMGVKAFFIQFLVNIIPSAITFDKNGFITEKWRYDDIFPKKIVYTYDKKNRLIDKSTFVDEVLETKDTAIYNIKGQLEKEILDLKTKDETIYTYTYNVDGELIQRNLKKTEDLPLFKEIYIYNNKRLVNKEVYQFDRLIWRGLYEYGAEGELIKAISQKIDDFIWHSKYTYDQNNQLKEEYLLINESENNGFLNKFGSDRRLTYHLTFSTDYLCEYKYTDDKQGNWVRMITYEQGVPMLYVERKIEYFK
ncbi:hypothetical protein JMN10_01885 [Capnocytophaga genosp. AHN8471]|uniref:Sugar-binding protein n=1 Tax=Capnocytophaga genosp. AHN8471 TaxID=327574 RepID=A0ABS1YXM3_9FLAO|nr:hypothetical protein [Capnocytophaga genosp. AHN8471]MBM0651157.1 hypothetical protein [Capnocytophaga genosp. AHN8471]MBM0660942.1 hypothetical protein [Capnocytophaga genosp. AHN8471]